MPLDHSCVFFPEANFQQCVDFYVAALKPLGYKIWKSFGPFITGLGSADHVVPGYETGDFWLKGVKNMPELPNHFAFRAKDRATVDAFYEAAIKAGGKDNGAPGLRPYHQNYYAAFVIDPAGNNVEAVCHLAG